MQNFIITAPTNKAKDILVNKYNMYIESLNINDIYSKDCEISTKNVNLKIEQC